MSTPGPQTAKQFVYQAYRLISAQNPTIPLHGDDENLGLTVLNQLLGSYASTGLMITIAQLVTLPLTIGQQYITFGPSTYTPAPDITNGRLANITQAWLNLDGVTYPLIDKSRDEFLASYKYYPLQGLPRFIILFPDAQISTLQIYPAPSQYFQFYLRGKFQLAPLTSVSLMNVLPDYYIKYLLFASAKDISMYTGRADAWTEKLEMELVNAGKLMRAASEVNLSITGDRASLLNGAWRVRAGI